MAVIVKRRDKKGRVLQNGESQDASGRYCYRYMDAKGKRKAVYSWRLTQADPIPAGKRPDKSLREKISEIERERDRGICGGDMTVGQLVEKYLRLKTGVTHNTLANYNFVKNVLAKEDFNYQKISKIKTSDAKEFLIKLQKDGRGYSSIHCVRGVLRPAFQMAVEDEMLLRNPFEFKLGTLIENDSETREALSKEDEERFLEFIKGDKHYSRYYDAMFILFKTGVRISEFCGITLNDIDFKTSTLNIDHQLQRTRNMEYVIESTKTPNGVRRLPMSEEVKEAFQRIINNRPKVKKEPVVDGRKNFLFLDKNGMPKVAQHWEKYFQLSVKKYNRIYKNELPEITPHVCRHTFCSSLVRANVNPKVIQYLMGHYEIDITLNVYAHVGTVDVRAEMKRCGLLGGGTADNLQ